MVLAYVVDEGKDKMVSGEAALAVVWSGDAAYAIEENPDLAYTFPRTGTNLWFDVVAIPKGAKNIDAAHKFIDFLNRPDIAFRNVDHIGYATPHLAAKDQLPKEITDDPDFYPTDEDLVNAGVRQLGATLKNTIASGPSKGPLERKPCEAAQGFLNGKSTALCCCLLQRHASML